MEDNPTKPVKGAFTGKCIHGKDGAKFVGGRLSNPNCEHCSKTEDER